MGPIFYTHGVGAGTVGEIARAELNGFIGTLEDRRGMSATAPTTHYV